MTKLPPLQIGDKVKLHEKAVMDDNVGLTCGDRGIVIDATDTEVQVETIGNYRQWWLRKYWIQTTW